LEKTLNIHRNGTQSGRDLAMGRLKECLDLLEESEDFNDGMNWNVEVVPGLSVEMMIHALVSAEQEMK